jgi:hypothetical protein
MRGRAIRSLGGLRGRGLSSGGGAPAYPIGDALRASIVAYYKLDDTTDSGPNGYTLTNNNAATFGAGKVGDAASLVAGSSQTLTATIAIGADLTVCGWVYVSGSANGDLVIVGDWAGGSACALFLRDSGTNLQAQWFSGSGNSVAGTFAATPDAWNWFVFKHNGTRGYFRVNHGTAQTQTAAHTVSGSVNLYIGANQVFGYPTFSADEIGIFDREITTDEEDYLYASGAGISLYP